MEEDEDDDDEQLVAVCSRGMLRSTGPPDIERAIPSCSLTVFDVTLVTVGRDTDSPVGVSASSSSLELNEITDGVDGELFIVPLVLASPNSTSSVSLF